MIDTKTIQQAIEGQFGLITKLTIKVVEYEVLAPEKFCYKVYFTDLAGQRRKYAYYPNTVGFQYLK